jgi:hypothetical protein
MNIKDTIKIALENTVLCRGCHSAKESYQYAEKMESVIKESIIDRLKMIKNSNDPVLDLTRLVEELEGKVEEEHYYRSRFGDLRSGSPSGTPITG